MILRIRRHLCSRDMKFAKESMNFFSPLSISFVVHDSTTFPMPLLTQSHTSFMDVVTLYAACPTDELAEDVFALTGLFDLSAN